MSDVVKSFNPDQVAKSVAIIVSTLKWVSTIIPGEVVLKTTPIDF